MHGAGGPSACPDSARRRGASRRAGIARCGCGCRIGRGEWNRESVTGPGCHKALALALPREPPSAETRSAAAALLASHHDIEDLGLPPPTPPSPSRLPPTRHRTSSVPSPTHTSIPTIRLRARNHRAGQHTRASYYVPRPSIGICERRRAHRERSLSLTSTERAHPQRYSPRRLHRRRNSRQLYRQQQQQHRRPSSVPAIGGTLC